MELPNSTSRRPVYLPRGIEEAETCCLSQREAARPTGFYRDALRTYAGMFSRLAWQDLPDSLARVSIDVDGQGTLRLGRHDPNSAGNVIGADDWAADRIVPNAMRALAAGERNPATTKALAARDGSWPPAPADRQRPPPARQLAVPLACSSQDGHRIMTTDPTDERTVANRRGGGRWIVPNN